MCLSLLAGPRSDLARTGNLGTARPCRRVPCMPSATATCAGISPRRCGARRWRAADARRWRSVPPASRVRSAARARPY